MNKQTFALDFFIEIDLYNEKELQESYNDYCKKCDNVVDFNGFLIKLLSMYISDKLENCLHNGIRFRIKGNPKERVINVNSIQHFEKVADSPSTTFYHK